MKTLLTLLALPLFLVATASADVVVQSKIESSQLNSDTTMKVKGDKMRVDIATGPAGAMSSIIDTKTGDTIQIMHSQKMAMKMGGDQLKQAMDQAKQKAGGNGNTAAPQPTGQSEKVGDYDCEIYTWTDGTNTGRLWIAKNHPQAAALKEVEKQMRNGFFKGQAGPDTSSLPGPALKTEVTTQGQKMTTTILSIKEQDVDAKEFDVPEGYQTLAMPTLPSGK